MKPDSRAPLGEEIELKLALPVSDPSGLAKRLARLAPLARRKATHLRMHNVYYDTPEQILRQGRVALRLRRIDGGAKPQWRQTLKMAGPGDSALSRRGEWEVAVPGAALVLQGLQGTPWSQIDPDGAVFRALGPCFVTTFERTSWLVRRRDGSAVEVALDVGHITAGDKTTPIGELELELLAGQPEALFDIAREIASAIAVLPANISKAERGYALLQDALDSPRRSQPAVLSSRLSLPQAAQQVLRETFGQFTANLNALRTSDDPEVVHQARVGWRRFKSAWRLFRPSLGLDAAPSWEPLRLLMTCLGELRDLDVARVETLASLAEAYAGADERRAQEWQALTQAMLHAANIKRKEVRYALQVPAVGATLLATTQWLEGVSTPKMTSNVEHEQQAVPLSRWARRRMVRLHKRLKIAMRQDDTADNRHRVRILSKRMRYGIEALHALLPKKRAKRWYRQALQLQTTLGIARDVWQASVLASRLESRPGPVDFLRGVAVGLERATCHR